MCIFLEKSCRGRRTLDALPSNHCWPPRPTLLLPPTITVLFRAFLGLGAFYCYRKRAKIPAVNVLHLFLPRFRAIFHFKLYSFVGGGAKNFLPQGTLATPLDIQISTDILVPFLVYNTICAKFILISKDLRIICSKIFANNFHVLPCTFA